MNNKNTNKNINIDEHMCKLVGYLFSIGNFNNSNDVVFPDSVKFNNPEDIMTKIFLDKTEAIKYWYLYLIISNILNGVKVNEMLTIIKNILHNEFTREEFDELSRDNEKLNKLLKKFGINNYIIFMNYIYDSQCGTTTNRENFKKTYEKSVKHPFYNDLNNILTKIDEKNCKYEKEIANNKLCKNIIYCNIKNVDNLMIGVIIARFINSLIDEIKKINENKPKNNVPRINKLCNRIKIKQVIIKGKYVIVFSYNEENIKQPLGFSPRNSSYKQPVSAVVS